MVPVHSGDMKRHVSVADDVSVSHILQIYTDYSNHRGVEWRLTAPTPCSVCEKTDDRRTVYSEVEEVRSRHLITAFREQQLQVLTYVWNVHGDAEVLSECVNETITTRAAGSTWLEGNAVDNNEVTFVVNFQVIHGMLHECATSCICMRDRRLGKSIAIVIVVSVTVAAPAVQLL